jgi:hypothetical protein
MMTAWIESWHSSPISGLFAFFFVSARCGEISLPRISPRTDVVHRDEEDPVGYEFRSSESVIQSLELERLFELVKDGGIPHALAAASASQVNCLPDWKAPNQETELKNGSW